MMSQQWERVFRMQEQPKQKPGGSKVQDRSYTVVWPCMAALGTKAGPANQGHTVKKLECSSRVWT